MEQAQAAVWRCGRTDRSHRSATGTVSPPSRPSRSDFADRGGASPQAAGRDVLSFGTASGRPAGLIAREVHHGRRDVPPGADHQPAPGLIPANPVGQPGPDAAVPGGAPVGVARAPRPPHVRVLDWRCTVGARRHRIARQAAAVPVHEGPPHGLVGAVGVRRHPAAGRRSQRRRAVRPPARRASARSSARRASACTARARSTRDLRPPQVQPPVGRGRRPANRSELQAAWCTEGGAVQPAPSAYARSSPDPSVRLVFPGAPGYRRRATERQLSAAGRPSGQTWRPATGGGKNPKGRR
jgi:hypothetical protein